MLSTWRLSPFCCSERLTASRRLRRNRFPPIWSRSMPMAGTKKSGKVLVESGKVRIDAPELPQGFFILEPSLKISYFVRPSPNRIHGRQAVLAIDTASGAGRP